MQYELTNHAMDRIRQRVGITSMPVALKWAADIISKGKRSNLKGGRVQYETDEMTVICANKAIVTVYPTEANNEYTRLFNDKITKEYTKIKTELNRELRKAEIYRCEVELAMFKAKNSKIVEKLSKRVTEALDDRQRIADKLHRLDMALNNVVGE